MGEPEGEATRTAFGVPADVTPLDLNEFLTWLRNTLQHKSSVLAEHRFREDLGLDAFQYFVLVLEFDSLTFRDAAANIDIFNEAATVRDLYLYYLTVVSMPRE